MLLKEILKVCPKPVLELMKSLMKSIDPDTTQMRYMEIGPILWWLNHIMDCPLLADLVFGGPRWSHYSLSGIGIKVTSLPVNSRIRRGLQFMELQCRMSLLTPFELDNERSYVQCKYYLRDAWSGLADPNKAGGVLVRIQSKVINFVGVTPCFR